MISSRRRGVNENISTYDSAGGKDYSVLNTWEAATDIDLVGGTQSEVLECYKGVHADSIIRNGATTSASYFRIIRPAVGDGHIGNPLLDGSCVAFNNAGIDVLFKDYELYFGLYDIVLRSTYASGGTGNTVGLYATSPVLPIYAGVICYQSTNTGAGTNRGFIHVATTGGIGVFVNCQAIENDGPGFSVYTAGAAYLYNCTSCGNGTADFYRNTATAIAKNCVGTFSGTWTSTTCITSTTTTKFLDSANDDYHLDALDTVCRSKGTDLSTDAIFAFDDDIDGGWRSVFWDIGADQCDAAANAASMQAFSMEVPTATGTGAPALLLDVYLEDSLVVATGTVTQANARLSLVDGTAFVWLNGVDLSAYQTGKYRIEITDSGGNVVKGFISATAPAGETLNNIYTSNFGAGEDSWNTSSGTLAGNIDAIGGEDDWLRFTINGNNSTHGAAKAALFTVGALHKLSYKYYIPSGQSNIDGIQFNAVNNITSVLTVVDSATAGSSYFTGAATYLIAYAFDGAASTFQDVGANDVFYVKGIASDQVTDPPATGALIVSSQGGTVRNFTSKGASFNPNDANGYTYKLIAEPLHFATKDFVDGAGAEYRGSMRKFTYTRKLPDMFYGVDAGDDTINIRFSNQNVTTQDTWEEIASAEELRGKSVRAVRWDAYSGVEFWFYGVITGYRWERGEFELTVEVRNSQTLEKQIPSGVITAAIFDASAQDIGKPINIILGCARGVPLYNVRNDTVNNIYDYLIGYGVIDSIYYDAGAMWGLKWNGKTHIDSTLYTFYDGSAGSPYPGYASVRFTTEQRDFSGNLIPITGDIKGLELDNAAVERNPVYQIKAILENTTWGRSESVNDASFAIAGAAVAAITGDAGTEAVYGDGGILEPTHASDIISELLTICRGRLEKNSEGEWEIFIDQLETSDFSCGDNDGYYNNCEVESVWKLDADSTISTLAAHYNRYAPDPLRMECTVNTAFGTPKEFTFDYMVDSGTAECFLNYVKNYSGRDEFLKVKFVLQGRHLNVGDIVTLTCPLHGITAQTYRVVEAERALGALNAVLRIYSAAIYGTEALTSMTGVTSQARTVYQPATIIGSNVTIGDGVINSGKVEMKIAPTYGDTYVRAVKTDFTNAEVGFIFGLDDSDSDLPKLYVGTTTKYINFTGAAIIIETPTFHLDAAGNLTATSVTLTGSITATSGAIGGWVVNAANIAATNITLYSGAALTARIEVGTGATMAGIGSANAAGEYAFWAGDTYANRAVAPFSVTAAGAIKGTSGTIGGWTLAATYFAGTNITLYSGAALTARIEVGTGATLGGIGSANAAGEYVFWAGNTYANRATAAFRVTAAGALVASSATITGSVTATLGAIGGWVIGATSLMSASSTVGMSSAVTGDDDVRFWAGHATPTSAPFRVYESGALVSTSGQIGGWQIGATALTSNPVEGAGNVVVQAGKSTFDNVDAGFILGFDDADNTIKFYLGNNTHYFNWNGTLFTIAGSFTSTATITGGTIQTAAAGGARCIMDSSGLRIYDAGPVQRAEINSNGSGWLGASNVFAWTTAGVLTASGFTVGTTTLNYTSGGNSTIVSATGTNAFTAGPTGAATFNVTHAGVLSCTGADVSGAITAITGNIRDACTIGTAAAVTAAKVAGWGHASDTTYIDGGDIYTGTVTAQKLYANSLLIGTVGSQQGSNMVFDGSFEVDADGAAPTTFWIVSAGVPLTDDDVAPSPSAYGAKTMYLPGDGNIQGVKTNYTIPAQVGQVIYIRFRAKGDAAGTSKLYAGVYCPGSSWLYFSGCQNVDVPNAWTEYTGSLTLAAGDITIQPLFVQAAGGNKAVWVDDVWVGLKPDWQAASDTTLIDGGAIYAGSQVTIGSGGHLKIGQTAYNTGTGIWMGDDGGTYKISCGVAGGAGWLWTGAILTVTGDIVVTSANDIKIHDDGDIKFYSDAGATLSGGLYSDTATTAIMLESNGANSIYLKPGSLSVAIKGSIDPIDNELYTCGVSARRWEYVYTKHIVLTSKIIAENLQADASPDKFVCWDSASKEFAYDSSSAKYKDNIRKADLDFHSVLGLEPKHYEVTKSDGRIVTGFGFIAEDAHALGLRHLVGFDKDGNPESFSYRNLPIYHHEIIKDHEQRLQALEEGKR